MSPLTFTLTAFATSIVAGFFGSLLGIGGGIIAVPSLTLLLHVDIRYAIGASIVSVVATSTSAAISYVREGYANIRVGMLLEVSTVTGALIGAVVAGQVNRQVLFLIFASVMVYTALSMLRSARKADETNSAPDTWSRRLGWQGRYFDDASDRWIEYEARRPGVGLGLSGLAGVISGLLGVGGGIIKVSVMNLLMGVPFKAASATSNFMIGVTAAAGAGVYLTRGEVDPAVAGPVALGVVLGSTIGSRWLGRIRDRTLKSAFVILLLYIAGQMAWKGVQ